MRVLVNNAAIVYGQPLLGGSTDDGDGVGGGDGGGVGGGGGGGGGMNPCPVLVDEDGSSIAVSSNSSVAAINDLPLANGGEVAAATTVTAVTAANTAMSAASMRTPPRRSPSPTTPGGDANVGGFFSSPGMGFGMSASEFQTLAEGLGQPLAMKQMGNGEQAWRAQLGHMVSPPQQPWWVHRSVGGGGGGVGGAVGRGGGGCATCEHNETVNKLRLLADPGTVFATGTTLMEVTMVGARLAIKVDGVDRSGSGSGSGRGFRARRSSREAGEAVALGELVGIDFRSTMINGVRSVESSPVLRGTSRTGGGSASSVLHFPPSLGLGSRPRGATLGGTALPGQVPDFAESPAAEAQHEIRCHCDRQTGIVVAARDVELNAGLSTAWAFARHQVRLQLQAARLDEGRSGDGDGDGDGDGGEGDMFDRPDSNKGEGDDAGDGEESVEPEGLDADVKDVLGLLDVVAYFLCRDTSLFALDIAVGLSVDPEKGVRIRLDGPRWSGAGEETGVAGESKGGDKAGTVGAGGGSGLSGAAGADSSEGGESITMRLSCHLSAIELVDIMSVVEAGLHGLQATNEAAVAADLRSTAEAMNGGASGNFAGLDAGATDVDYRTAVPEVAVEGGGGGGHGGYGYGRDDGASSCGDEREV